MGRTRRRWVPILIGVLAIVFTIAVLVGWNIVFTSYYVLATKSPGMPDLGAWYWLILSIGSLFLVMVVVTLLLLLIGNVRQSLLVDQQKMFVDSVTHELKSPLASLSLALETIEAREMSPEDHGRFVRMMKKDVQRLRTFIEHVLDAARLEGGQRELRLQAVVVPSLVEELAQRIRDRYELEATEIRTEIGKGLTEPVVTDQVAVETILLNLIDNAVKYSKRPARVTVRASSALGRMTVAVEDRGVGIPVAERKRIFRRFYRLDREGVGSRGTGLGLYMVDALARRLGGVVQMTEGPDGSGSCFTLDLPVRYERARGEEPARMS
jgi:signal transduction histidine kinase